MLAKQFKDTSRIYFGFYLVFTIITFLTFFLFVHFKNQSLQRSIKSANLKNNVAIIVKNSSKIKRKNLDQASFVENLNSLKESNHLILDIQEVLGSDDNHDKRVELYSFFQKSPLPINNIDEVWNNYVKKNKDFLGYVKTNNWKTLTSISKRMVARTPRNFDWNRVPSNFINDNEKDYQGILKIVDKSTLSQSEKESVKKRVERLKESTSSVQRSFSKIIPYKDKYSEYLKFTDKWVQRWNKVTLGKKSVKGNIIGFKDLLTLLFIMFLSIIMFYFIAKKIGEYLELKTEKNNLAILNKLIVKDDISFSKDSSFEYKSSVKSLREYIKRKTNFGNILQKTLPYPAILVTEDFTVKWCNELFNETFDLVCDNPDKLWNSFKERIENDLDFIEQSFETLVAGVSKVDINGERLRSYQAYSSPIEISGKKYLMIFFNSLNEVNESISLHSNSLINSLEKILEDLEDGKIDANELSNEFSVNEVKVIYEKLLDFVSYKHNKSKHLEKNINNLGFDLKNSQNLLKKIEELNEESIGVYKDISGQFSSLQEALVKSMSLNENLFQRNSESNKLFNELRVDALDENSDFYFKVSNFLESSITVNEEYSEHEEQVIDLLQGIVGSTKLIGSHLTSVSNSVKSSLQDNAH